MLTKSDLLAIKGLLKPLETDIGVIKSDVGSLKTDVGTLKSDVGTLKTDVSSLKTDVGTLKSDFKDMKSRVINLESDMKVVRSDIKLLHKKSDKFMAKTNANTKGLKTYKNVVRRKINLVVDTFDDRCLKLEQSPNFAILRPN